MTETRRLYYEDVYKKEFTATVVECRERKKGYASCAGTGLPAIRSDRHQ